MFSLENAIFPYVYYLSQYDGVGNLNVYLYIEYEPNYFKLKSWSSEMM